MYGSILNGTLSKTSSDLDLTLIIDNQSASHFKLLQDVIAVILNYQSVKGRYSIEDSMPRLDSAGYILKIRDKVENIDIDIAVNRSVEIHNSMLLKEYCKLDERLHKLIYTLKYWNKETFKEDKPYMHLNNFTICLMIISYMQKEKMLPNL